MDQIFLETAAAADNHRATLFSASITSWEQVTFHASIAALIACQLPEWLVELPHCLDNTFTTPKYSSFHRPHDHSSKFASSSSARDPPPDTPESTEPGTTGSKPSTGSITTGTTNSLHASKATNKNTTSNYLRSKVLLALSRVNHTVHFAFFSIC
jgi:hypothetical protein